MAPNDLKPDPYTEELAPAVDLTRPLPASTATAANSTTLADLKRKALRAKLAITALTSLATVAAVLPIPVIQPWNFVGAGALYAVALAVAYFTNSLTPEELEGLLSQVQAASSKFPTGKK